MITHYTLRDLVTAITNLTKDLIEAGANPNNWKLSMRPAKNMWRCCVEGTCSDWGTRKGHPSSEAPAGHRISNPERGAVPLEVAATMLVDLGVWQPSRSVQQLYEKLANGTPSSMYFSSVGEVAEAIDELRGELTDKDLDIDLLGLATARRKGGEVLWNRMRVVEEAETTGLPKIHRIPINPFQGKCPPGCLDHDHEHEATEAQAPESESLDYLKLSQMAQGGGKGGSEGKEEGPGKQSPAASWERVKPQSCGLRVRPVMLAGGRTENVEQALERAKKHLTSKNASRAVHALSRVMRQMQVGNGLQPSPRISPEKLVRELVSKRISLTRARRDEIMRKPVMIMVDTSGSCSSVADATMLAAGVMMLKGEDIIVLEHSNGCPIALYGRHEVVERAKKRGFNPTGNPGLSAPEKFRKRDLGNPGPNGVADYIMAYTGFITKPNDKADLAGILAFGDFDAIMTYAWLSDLYDLVLVNQQPATNGRSDGRSRSAVRVENSATIRRVRTDLRPYAGVGPGMDRDATLFVAQKRIGSTFFTRPPLGYYEGVDSLSSVAAALEDQAKSMAKTYRRTWESWLATV